MNHLHKKSFKSISYPYNYSRFADCQRLANHCGLWFHRKINKDQSNTTWLGNAATIKNIQKRDGKSPLSAYSYCIPQRILGHQPLSRRIV